MPRILYIEDNRDNRMLVRRILMASDYDFVIQEAESAIKGIDMARTDPPDLILMDLSMPEMDGLTATQRLRDFPELNHVPIVALTANAMQGDKERTLSAGCDGYISKPIDVDKIADDVFRYLSCRAAQDAAAAQTAAQNAAAQPTVSTAPVSPAAAPTPAAVPIVPIPTPTAPPTAPAPITAASTGTVPTVAAPTPSTPTVEPNGTTAGVKTDVTVPATTNSTLETTIAPTTPVTTPSTAVSSVVGGVSSTASPAENASSVSEKNSHAE